MGSTLNTKPLSGKFGIEINNLDIPKISDEALKSVLLNLYEHRVVVIKTQGLTQAELLAFSKRVGNPIPLSLTDADYPEIALMTNMHTDSKKVKRGAAHWHTDQSFKEEISSATMLYSVQAPNTGGETLFCDMVTAYEALSPKIKEHIEDLIVEHRHGVAITARPGDHTPIPPKGWDQSTTVYHPLVKHHPITNKKTLYAITGTTQGIQGMEQETAQTLLQELCDHAFQDQFITQHTHSVNDLVMWDNPTTMHSATPISAATGPHDTRVIHRISLRGYPTLFNTSKN